jgi:hypothetical protein
MLLPSTDEITYHIPKTVPGTYSEDTIIDIEAAHENAQRHRQLFL